MAQRLTNHKARQHDDLARDPLAPFTVIRTETVLSRLPIHNLAKKGQRQITIMQKNAQGEIQLHWQVLPNAAIGEPRQLAYKLDTLIINRRIDALGRPLPKLLRLDTFKQICATLNMRASGRTNGQVKQALHENAGAYIIATLRYTATDGTEHTLEAGFTRYSVVFTGERLPDGTTADAVYLLLNEPYWEILNNAPTRPLDYDYLKALTPAAQRCYEIISYKLFAALKYQYPEANMLYSEYCLFSAQQRYTDYTHVKKQMYKVHKPHLTSTYLARVRYEATTDAAGHPDWCLYYVPGPKAQAEYAAFNTRLRPRLASTPAAALAVDHATVDEDVPTPRPVAAPPPTSAPPVAAATLTAEAHALVQYFHQRFHGASAVVPTTAKAIAQAQDLIAQYGVDQARHLIEFSASTAKETKYHPQTFSGILHYLPQALADYVRVQQRHDAEARAQEDRRRVQADDERRAQYEAYRAERLAQLRVTLQPEELAAIEAAAVAQFERTTTGPIGRDRLRRLAVDAAVLAHEPCRSFAEWQATCEGKSAPASSVI